MGGSFDLSKVVSTGAHVAFSPPAVAAAPAPPPSNGKRLQVKAPQPIPRIEPGLAIDSLTIDREATAKLDVMVAQFIVPVAMLAGRGREFDARKAELQSLGREDLDGLTEALRPLLVRPTGRLDGGGPAAASALSDALAGLHELIDGLNPRHETDLLSGKKRGLFSRGDPLRIYFTRYQQCQGDLDASLQKIQAFEIDVRKDDGDLDHLRAGLAERMGRLRMHLYLASRIEATLADRVTKSQATDAGRAAAFEELLGVVRGTVQDLGNQLAVLVESYLCVERIETNASELTEGLDGVRTATLAALRTAVEVGRAVLEPTFGLDLIPALRTVDASKLPAPAPGADGGPGSPGYELSRLSAAFDDVYAIIAEVDYWRDMSASAMTRLARSIQSQVPASK